MKFPIQTMTLLFTGVLLLTAGNARAEMSQGTKQTLTACAYMGGIGAAAGHVFEQGAVKYGVYGCLGAGAAVAGYNYLVIPTEAAEAPKESELKQDDSEQVSE